MLWLLLETSSPFLFRWAFRLQFWMCANAVLEFHGWWGGQPTIRENDTHTHHLDHLDAFANVKERASAFKRRHTWHTKPVGSFDVRLQRVWRYAIEDQLPNKCQCIMTKRWVSRQLNLIFCCSTPETDRNPTRVTKHACNPMRMDIAKWMCCFKTFLHVARAWCPHPNKPSSHVTLYPNQQIYFGAISFVDSMHLNWIDVL